MSDDARRNLLLVRACDNLPCLSTCGEYTVFEREVYPIAMAESLVRDGLAKLEAWHTGSELYPVRVLCATEAGHAKVRGAGYES